MKRAATQRDRRGSDTLHAPVWAWLTLYVFGLVCLAVTVIGRSWLPARFFYDSDIIQAIARGQEPFVPDRGYASAAAVYRILGLADLPTVAALLGFVAFILVLCCAIGFGSENAYGLDHFVLTASAMVLAVTYLAGYAKDVFALIGILPILWAMRLPRAQWWQPIAGILLYGSIFRTYWLLIGALMLVTWLALRLVARSSHRLPVWVFAAVPVIFLALWSFVIAPRIAGQPGDFARVMVNENRRSVDGASAIHPIFGSTSAPRVFAGLIVTGIGLIVPIPLLLNGSAPHVVYAIAIFALWVCLFRRLVLDYPRLDDVNRGRALIGLSFLLALITVQSVFEPDYGSYLRHLTPALPVMIALLHVLARAERTSSVGAARGR